MAEINFKKCFEIANKCYISDKNMNFDNITAKSGGTATDKHCDFNYRITKIMSVIF